MKVVKMYVWEGYFLEKLMANRKAEITYLKTRHHFLGLFQTISRSSSQILLIITLAIYFSKFELQNFKISDLFAVSMYLKQEKIHIKFTKFKKNIFKQLTNYSSTTEEGILFIL